MISFLFSPLGRALGASVVAFALLAGAYAYGVSSERQRAALEAALDALDTHERINDADTGSGDPDADRDWLRDRAGR